MATRAASPQHSSIVVSGMRPTGRLHLGHLIGALRNWLRLQAQHRCFFFVADWHALTTDQEHTANIEPSTIDMVADWLAAGIDPDRAVIFRQSAVKEHAELHLLFSMVTPTPWLVRNPTVKEQARDLGLFSERRARTGTVGAVKREVDRLLSDEETVKDAVDELLDEDLETLQLNYGYLGYPVLQAADILMYKATGVPVGIDQVPHIELTREIARRFNFHWKPRRAAAPDAVVFPEPETLLTEVPKVPGTDGRKMSKSYNNAVFLNDAPETIDVKLSRMMTDPRRVRRTDPGEPNDCPAFNLHRIYCTPDEIDWVMRGCRTAGIGCLECKRVMIKHVVAELAPIRERRAELDTHPERVTAVLERGNDAARQVAAATMREVRDAIGLP